MNSKRQQSLFSFSLFPVSLGDRDIKKKKNLKNKHIKVLPDGSVVKNSQAKQEMRMKSLDQEDPLEKEMTTYSSILAWRIPWWEESGRLQFIGSQKIQTRLSN